MKQFVVFKKAAAAILVYIILSSFPFKLIAQLNQFSDSSKNVEFFQLIRSNNIEALEESIGHGSNANATLNGFSALMAATLNGSLESMASLPMMRTSLFQLRELTGQRLPCSKRYRIKQNND